MDEIRELIDIIVPVWECEQYIDAFILSIKQQTYTHFKLFFSYDDSSDSTYDKLISYYDDNEIKDKIEILKHENRCGMGPARDYAMDSGLLTGKYLICLDIDDRMEPDFLEEMVNNAEKFNVDVVMCGLDSFDDATGKIINTQMTNCPEEIIYDIKSFYKIAYMNCSVWNKLYRREVIEEYRFGDAQHLEDGIYLCKILPSIKSIKFVNRILYHYRVSGHSAQSRVTKKRFETCWDYYRNLATLYRNDVEKYSEYVPIFELVTFIKCGIGLTHRYALRDMRHMHDYIKYSRNMMDEIVPGWRTNHNLVINGFTKRSYKENMVTFCSVLYKMGCFEIFIVIYWMFKKISIREVRW